MVPSNVNYFWEDVVCKYWKWAQNIGLPGVRHMKPALSVMHAKAHNWTCQVKHLLVSLNVLLVSSFQLTRLLSQKKYYSNCRPNITICHKTFETVNNTE